ncbi:MAG: pyridoxamine 5'-phosphate oxidase [Marinilabiliaceae bacterium]|nr:pyridoxamine 5'-phosphate oxidase [Marinilabiliaceae bacterium]
MDNDLNLFKIRQEYKLKELTKEELGDDPFIAFKLWLNEAIQSKESEPTAMSLATVSSHGQPSCRIVLLKEIKPDCICFFSNYNSKKGKELSENSKAALTFFWPLLERQIRIEGIIRKSDADISDIYFKSRPYESQIGAWASRQSELIPNRDYLVKQYQKYKKMYSNPDLIPRPSYWGGYQLKPHFFEFWQGRQGRLHDRITFDFKNSNWVIDLLAP